MALVAEHSLLGILAKILINAIVLYAAASLIRGAELKSMSRGIVVALVVTLLNVTLGALLKFFAFPFIFVTFGLFNFVIDAFILWLAARWMKGFTLQGYGPALLLALVVALFNWIMYGLFF